MCTGGDKGAEELRECVSGMNSEAPVQPAPTTSRMRFLVFTLAWILNDYRERASESCKNLTNVIVSSRPGRFW